MSSGNGGVKRRYIEDLFASDDSSDEVTNILADDGDDEEENSDEESNSVSNDDVETPVDDDEDRELSEESNFNKKGAAVTVDLDILECDICCVPLRPPLFQCENGHVVCPSCHNKLNNKCPTCRRSITGNRCTALERIIESIKVPCTYANDGCKEILTYADRMKHVPETCIYPCFCPVPGCSFCGINMKLYDHLDRCHVDRVEKIKGLSQSTTLSIKRKEPFTIYLVEPGLVFLLLNNNNRVRKGNELSLTCIQSLGFRRFFKYRLEVFATSENVSLQLQSRMTCFKRWHDYPKNHFLFVPDDFYWNLKTLMLVRFKIEEVDDEP